jgi:hypothetical protein
VEQKDGNAFLYVEIRVSVEGERQVLRVQVQMSLSWQRTSSAALLVLEQVSGWWGEFAPLCLDEAQSVELCGVVSRSHLEALRSGLASGGECWLLMQRRMEEMVTSLHHLHHRLLHPRLMIDACAQFEVCDEQKTGCADG